MHVKCTSAYPAKPEDANLVTIKNMMESYDVIGGLSDHTLGIGSIVAVFRARTENILFI